MKANLSKMLRSVLSLVLALSLVVGLCPAVFATETPTDDLSNIDWNSDLSDYDWGNVDWSKVDWSTVQLDKVDLEKVNWAEVDFEQVDYEQIDWEKVDLEKVDWAEVDMSKVDLEKIDWEKVDLEKVDWENVDLSQVDLTKVDLSKVDLSKVDLANTNLAASLSLSQIVALLKQYPSAAYSVLYNILDNRGYIDEALTALDKVEVAVNALANRLPGIENAPAGMATVVRNVQTGIEKLRALIEQGSLNRADLLDVFQDLRDNMLTLRELAAEKLPAGAAGVVQDAVTAVNLAWDVFIKHRIPGSLNLIITVTRNFAANHKEAILNAGKELAAYIVANADVLDPVLPEGIKAGAYEIVDLLRAGQERKAITVALELVDATIAAVKDSGLVNKQVAWQLLAKIQTLSVTVKDAVYARYVAATRDMYTVGYGSTYVALGDASVVSNSYANKIAQELHMHYTNLGDADINVVGDTFAVIQQNAATIAAADLITIGYDNNTFAVNALNQDINIDWEGHIGATGAAAIRVALNDIKNYLVNTLGLSEDQALTITAGIEAYAYSAGSYAWNAPQVVKAVRELNADAVVVLVGMYNPLENITMEVKGVSLNVGEYVNYLVDLVGAHGLAYSMLTLDCIYVDAPAVETEYEAAGKPNVMDAVGMIEYLATEGAMMRASDAGDEYIKTQILNALTISYEGIYRLEGANRFETAIKVADEMKYLNNVDKFDTMIIASGEVFADALAGTYLATTKNAPVLLSFLNDFTADRKYDKMTADYVAANLAANGTVYILGGEKAVSEDMETLLTSRGVAADSIVRLAGENRFETNLAILEELGVGNEEILVCTGTVFADTLSASATGLPVLLVWNDRTELFDYQEEFLAGLNGNAVTILGGEAAVSAKLADAVAEAAGVEVARVSGATRIETSIAVANKYFPDAKQMVLATGWEFADALSGGSMASTLEAPIILTMGEVNADGYEYSKGWNYGVTVNANYTSVQGIKKGVILGGTAEKCIPDYLARSSFGLPADATIYVK